MPQIFKIVFSADTLSDALAAALAAGVGQEIDRMSDQTAQVAAIFAGILQPPAGGYYASISGASIPTAAVLAPVLFILRLAIYHWRRLFGEDDRLMQVIGDWLAAGFLAVAAGPFLDLLVQTGWWVASGALGETAQLAQDFLSVTIVSNVVRSLMIPGKPSVYAAIFAIGGGLGGLVGVIGLAFAFAVAQAVLFVLGVLAPVISVLAVVPQMRWLRALWIKAVAILCLLPLAAGGIFKASITLAGFYGGEGLTDLIIRILWLWGAAGFILSLAGILGKVTLSTAAEAVGKLGKGARSLLAVGSMANVGTAQKSSGSVPMQSQGPASSWINQLSIGGQIGRMASSSFSLASTERFIPDYGFSSVANARMASTTGYSAETFKQGFAAVSEYLGAAGLDPIHIAENYPEDTGRIVSAYLRASPQIIAAPEPLVEAARMGGAHTLGALFGNSQSRTGEDT